MLNGELDRCSSLGVEGTGHIVHREGSDAPIGPAG
jgi:hypothetical protein